MAVYAIVSTSYPRHRDDPGGHFVRAEAQQLARQGHEVRVLCPGPGRADGGVRVHGCGGGRAFGWPGAPTRIASRPSLALPAAAFCARARCRLMRWRDVDRVVAHFLLPGALIAWPRHAPVEIVGHGSDLRLWSRLPRALRVALLGRLVERGVRFRFAAEHGRERICSDLPVALADRLMASSRVELPPLDLVPEEVARRRSPRGRAGERPVVALCGRLVGAKRFALGLAAVAAVDAEALIIGDGPERTSLQGVARDLGLTARFLGQRPRGEALAELASAQALIHPSRAEGAPTVVREARALGLPVVCSDAGDLRRWAERDAGIQVAADGDLAAALARALMATG